MDCFLSTISFVLYLSVLVEYLESWSFIFSRIECVVAQGYIHRVEANEVYLKFAPELHLQHKDGNLYNVQFTYNRVNMRRLYQAIGATDELVLEFLSSTSATNIPILPKQHISHHSKTLHTNSSKSATTIIKYPNPQNQSINN